MAAPKHLIVVLDLDPTGALVGASATETIKLVIRHQHDTKGTIYGIEYIDGNTDGANAYDFEILRMMEPFDNTVQFRDGIITWRWNTIERTWEAWYGSEIVHISVATNHPTPEQRNQALINASHRT